MEEKENKKKTKGSKNKEDKDIVKEIDQELGNKDAVQVEEEKEKVREVIVEKKVGFNYLEVILIMIITLIIGGFLGSFIDNFGIKEKEIVKEVIAPELEEFMTTYEDIKKNYYEELDEEKLLDAGIKGMLDFLGDKYSLYMDREETETFNQQVEGKYEGIGVEIVQDDTGVMISRVFDDTPAKKAGLQIGDRFLKINSEDVTTKTSSEIVEIIKSSGDSKVILVVDRNGEQKEFTVKREEVQIESVVGEIIEKDDKKIGYLAISIFASNTYQQFLNELTKLEVEGIDSLVIDVRGNTGGYLSSVTNITSLFLEKGKLIYQLDTRGAVEKIADSTKTNRNYPISVLIDSGSASASEILAAALKESYGANIVGTSSYGKGTVQKAYQLESGATVKYTIQKWLTPDGNWINEVGVEPTVPVELAESYFENPSNETDNQLQKALEVLSK